MLKMMGKLEELNRLGTPEKRNDLGMLNELDSWKELEVSSLLNELNKLAEEVSEVKDTIITCADKRVLDRSVLEVAVDKLLRATIGDSLDCHVLDEDWHEIKRIADRDSSLHLVKASWHPIIWLSLVLL
jgi:hypothetical protein